MENLGVNLSSFYKDRRVLVTGHTGFKGGWLSLWLYSLGAKVHGISLAPDSNPNLFELSGLSRLVDHQVLDIRNFRELKASVSAINPEIVFHLAAQPLVRLSYKEPVDTFATNVMGTVHLLESLRDCDTCRVCVAVTTDKVYRNREWYYPYREGDALGGHDPYSASKACSELTVSSYRDSFLDKKLALATARAGNVIGGGDWSQDRLIPDAVRAWSKDEALMIRSPHSVRPWQHVLEPLHAYMKLVKALWFNQELAGAYNFGPNPSEAATVQQVIDLALNVYGKGRVEYSVDNNAPHEAGILKLETSLAKEVLGIEPRFGLEESVKRTMEWYKKQHSGQNVLRLIQDDIAAYGVSL